MPNLPRGVLDATLNLYARQQDQHLADQVEQGRQQAFRYAMNASVPDLDSLLGPLAQPAQQAAQAVQQATQSAAGMGTRLADSIPDLGSLLGESMAPKPSTRVPETTPSGTPSSMPTTGSSSMAGPVAPTPPLATAASAEPRQTMSQPATTDGQYGPIDNTSRATFVRTAYPYMLDAAGGDRNLAELMLAKAISENGDVGSGGGFIGNNFSGIKGTGSAGSFEADTWEYVDGQRVNTRAQFAAYKTPVEGFQAFMGFLHENPRYERALANYRQSGDADRLFDDILAAGYATDPKWANAVRAIRRDQVVPALRQGDARQSMNAVASPSAASPPAPWASADVPPASAGAQGDTLMLRQPVGPATMGRDTFETPAQYDPNLPEEDQPSFQGTRPYEPAPLPADTRDIDAGPREGGAFQAPVGGFDDPGTQITTPAIPSSPYQPAQAAAMEPEPTRFEPTPEAPTVTQRIGSTLGEAVGAGAQAAMEASAVPSDPMEVAQRSLPSVTGLQIYQDAVSAFGDVVGRRVGEALGLSDDDMVSVAGVGVSPQDVAGFAGQMVLDPSNYVGGGAARSVAGLGVQAVQEGAEAAARAGREGVETAGRGVRGLGSRIRRGLAENAERMRAADARMAAEGSTLAPSTFGMGVEQAGFEPAARLPQPAPSSSDALRQGQRGSMDLSDTAPGLPQRNRTSASTPTDGALPLGEGLSASSIAPSYRPAAPDGVTRRYHGTASVFDAADPARFAEDGLYGPGYYTTSDPRVADSYAMNHITGVDSITTLPNRIENMRYFLRKATERGDASEIQRIQGVIDEMEARAASYSGPNVRAIDIPPGVNLLDMDAPLTDDVLTRVERVIGQIRGRPEITDELTAAVARVRENVARRAADPSQGPPLVNDALYVDLAAAAERVPGMGKGLVTEILERAGFDGIAHQGGQRVPMLDAAGAPIEHDVSVIFPGSVNKIRNAFAGTYGGATIGASPGRGRGILDTLTRDAGSALGTGVFGSTVAQANAIAEGREPTLEDAAAGFGMGMVAGPLIRRGMGRARGGAMATPGASPGGGRQPELFDTNALIPQLQRGLGDRPPMGFSPERIASAAQQEARRAAEARARGVEPLTPLQWTGEAVKNIGYSSMIGPATATVNVFGNLLEPLWAIPKEAARAVMRGNPREFAEMASGAFYGLTRVGDEMLDAIRARGRYASNPDQPTLSQRTTNRAGKAFAEATEFGGRIFSGLPDAFFGSIARHAGRAREAAQIATDEGLKGAAWKQRVNDLLSEVQAQESGELARFPDLAERIIKAGDTYADEQTFRQQLGTWGRGASRLAGRDIPVVGNFLTPFFTTPWNMGLTQLERTPVGAVMNRKAGFDKWYDATVGTAIIGGLVVGPAAQGRITGNGPDDPEKRQMLQAQGWRPYHTLIGDTYVPNRVFGIYGKLLNAVGDAHDAMAYQKKDATAGQRINDAAKRVGNLVKQEPYLQGLANILEIFDSQNAAGGVERLAASNLARLVPYAATGRTIGTAIDPQDRAVENDPQGSMGARIAQRAGQSLGMRQGLPAAQDVLGRPRENQQQGVWSVLPRLSPRQPDPAIQLFQDAGVDIGGPRDQMTVGRTPVSLKPAEQRAWQRHRGQFIQDYAGAYTGNAEFMALPPAQKARYLQTFLEKAADYADRMTLSEMDRDDLTTRAIEGATKKAGVAP